MSDWMYAHSLPLDMHPDGCTCGGCAVTEHECPHCSNPSLYDKTEAGYPGLYHCTTCKVWIDWPAGEAWTFAADPEVEPDCPHTTTVEFDGTGAEMCTECGRVWEAWESED